ncbi:MAG: hypothetical protein HY329_09030, partial [Chloroflexi bacterium]|nr:hypothetical protein [Chloroflexota bacterium]
REVAADLDAQFAAIETRCRAELKDLGDRKSTALYFQTCAHPKILFAMLDGKDYAPHIWRLIRPASTRTFRLAEPG